jgi:hypothetical protein
MTTIFDSETIHLALHAVDSEFPFDQYINWSKNRPPDMVRVYQIKEYLLNNNLSLAPGIVSCWTTKTTPFQIYDGIHRFLAVKALVEADPTKVIHVLIQILVARKEQEVIDDFVNLNKSVCIPSIYIEDTSVLKKTVCQDIAEALCKRYPSFISPSRKPYAYNFNRDILIEWISTWNIDFSKAGIQHLAVQELLKLNGEAKTYVERMNIPHPNKCKYHNFFLFYLEKTDIKRKIEQVLK